ncbi:MAG: cytochrome d ubiquinol oxidase subunit II [Fibromonadaceae bacterium]|jgi:cytochrome d ubiquinol oxidase subunit II|nr:cytochrome d ubiquinol oxidase subunit II [Fibromonadaceae bacterium]
MSLEILWFVLIAVLWAGFFFLEGFDFGVGVLQFFLGKNNKERGTYIFSITPYWNGNMVWLLTAGAATFAAFPAWYATFFSSLYTLFVLLLLALIVRGACFEIRHRANIQKFRFGCDMALAVSSFMAGLLSVLAMANTVTGIPIDANGTFRGGFLDLIKPLALLYGLLGVSLFITNGALFLTLRIEGELQERAFRFAKKSIIVTVAMFAITAPMVLKFSTVCIVSLVSILVAVPLVYRQYFRTAFICIALCTAFAVATLFSVLFPNVLISSISPENNLTIWNSASSALTLKVMSIIAVIFIPAIMVYQIWSYYVFRKRINPRNANLEV